MIVYKITNKVNGKIYIGVTKNHLSTRWAIHKWDARNGTNSILHRAIRRYGVDAFRREIVYEASSVAEMLMVERGLIAQYGTTNPRVGYNIRSGGEEGNRTPKGVLRNEAVSILNEEIVRFIRDPEKTDVPNGTMRDLVETRFGIAVKRDTIRDARRGDTWLHIKDCPPLRVAQGVRAWANRETKRPEVLRRYQREWKRSKRAAERSV